MIAELMPRVGDVRHDEQTRRLYPRSVSAECTCGFHSPPPGLADNPEAHIEGCGYRAAMARIVNPVLMVPNNEVRGGASAPSQRNEVERT